MLTLNQQSQAAAQGIGIKTLAENSSKGPAFTGLYRDQVIAIAGVIPFWEGVGEAWAMFSPEAYKHAFFIHRGVIKVLGQIVAKSGLRRVQAMVQKDFAVGNRWIKALGFQFEGEMPEYFNRKTFNRYAIVLTEG